MELRMLGLLFSSLSVCVRKIPSLAPHSHKREKCRRPGPNAEITTPHSAGHTKRLTKWRGRHRCMALWCRLPFQNGRLVTLTVTWHKSHQSEKSERKILGKALRQSSTSIDSPIFLSLHRHNRISEPKADWISCPLSPDNTRFSFSFCTTASMCRTDAAALFIERRKNGENSEHVSLKSASAPPLLSIFIKIALRHIRVSLFHTYIQISIYI